MKIRPSSALRNDYTQISELAKVSGEPIFITNKGEDDGVFMSMAAYEEREKMFRHRDRIYAAEMSRLNGDPTYTQEELDAQMEELFRAYEK
jgi:PHD/YefM family antitoxin component YafN of YafNO toxin-antitoxin module